MKITKGKAGATEILACYEENGVRENNLLSQTCTAPVIVVFPDGALDEEGAQSLMKATHLDTVSAQLGAVIAVARPCNGDNWTQADCATYTAVTGIVEDSSDADVEYGIVVHPPRVPWVKEPSKERIFKLSGSLQRMHVIGFGKGADFVGTFMLSHQEQPIVVARDKTRMCDVTPVSVLLIGSKCEFQPQQLQALPTHLILLNAAEGTVKVSKQPTMGCPVHEESAPDVGAWINAHYCQLAMKKRRQCGVLVDVGAQERKYIIASEEIESYRVRYALYLPATLDPAKAKNVPLIMTLHGGGNTALYQLEASGWLNEADENGFAVVAVDHHVPIPAAVLVELLRFLLRKYAFLSSHRVFATGFSMGAIKTWELMEAFPTFFAGVAPMDAAMVPISKEKKVSITPCFYVGGTASPLEELPHHCDGVLCENRVDARLAWLLLRNDVCKDYVFNQQENLWWGIKPNQQDHISDPLFVDTTYEVDKYKSKNGCTYTALCAANGKYHEVYQHETKLAWQFLKHFYRKSDGDIAIMSDEAGILLKDGGTNHAE